MYCCYNGNSEGETYNEETQWTKSQERYLISLYRQQPCLWQKDNPSYLNYYARRLAYETIYEEIWQMGVTLVEVIMKIRQVRKNYVDELRRVVEAQSVGSNYKSEHIWFDELHNFLYSQLHHDEMEIIEAISRDICYSSNYCDDDDDDDEEEETYRFCARESPSGGLSEAISTSKPSCCLSTKPAVETPSRPRQSNDDENSCRRRGNFSTVRFSSDVDRGCSRTASRMGTAVIRRTQSNPEGGGVATAATAAVVVCENESIQLIRTNEKSMTAQSSMQSCLTARKSSDQLDLFAKSIVCRLRQMNPDTAAKAQKEIQKVLTNVARDTESNVVTTLTMASKTDLSIEGTEECNYDLIPLLPYIQKRNCVSRESNITAR